MERSPKRGEAPAMVGDKWRLFVDDKGAKVVVNGARAYVA